MPDYVGGNVIGDRADSFRRSRKGKIGFVDTAGQRKFTTFKTAGPDATRGELDTLREALGAASNAGIFYDGLEDLHETNQNDARAINDAYGTVTHLIVFMFARSDDSRIKEKIELPAPNRDLLVFGGKKPLVKDRADNAQIDNIITAGQALLNAALPDGEPNFEFAYAYYSDRSGRGVGSGPLPNITDPVI
ncbi:MAG: hypothetical protein AAF126_02620 [Chloroflexota bacterium]